MTESPAAPRFTHAREPRAPLTAAQRAATIARDDASDRRVVPHSARGAVQTSVTLRRHRAPKLGDFGA